jgi:hypothetical protein
MTASARGGVMISCKNRRPPMATPDIFRLTMTAVDSGTSVRKVTRP